MQRIGEFLVTGQPEPSMTSNDGPDKGQVVCYVCNKEFIGDVWVSKGVTIPRAGRCPDCITAEVNNELEHVKELQWDKWVKQYGVPLLFIEKDFDNFKQELNQKAFDAVKNFKDDSLVLLSPGVYGVGKTHLVCALADHLLDTKEPASFRRNSYQIIRHHCPVHFTTEQKLLSRIRQTFNKIKPKAFDLDEWDMRGGGESYQETEENIYEELNRFGLLIIDDVGKVRPKDYSFLQGVYFRIIDDRYTNEQKVILTTNLDFKELEEHIGGACADRLREMCGKDGFIKMVGKSYRR